MKRIAAMLIALVIMLIIENGVITAAKAALVPAGVHGANRLGGNAVSDFVVFGRIAGEMATELALAK